MNSVGMTVTSPSVGMILLAMTVMMSSGCGDQLTEYVGTATWNGTPIADGYVELSPMDGKGQVVGTNIVNGKFTLRTQPGPKTVAVTAKRKIGETKPTERIPNPEPIYHQFIPEQYNSATELKIVIDSSDPNVELALTGTELKPKEMSRDDRDRYRAQGGGLSP